MTNETLPWWPPDLSERQPGPELMDDEASCTDAELATAFDELGRINRQLGGISTSVEAFERLHARVGGDAWHVADVGGGDGELARAIVQWGRVRSVDIRVDVIELSPFAAARARRRLSEFPEVQVVEGDLRRLEASSYDVVHACLVLHHFDGEQATDALAAMARAARRGVVVNDLRRGRVPWLLIRVATTLFSRCRLVRYDGPVSVARGFRSADWRRMGDAIGLPLEVLRSWAFRWAVVGVKPGAAR